MNKVLEKIATSYWTTIIMMIVIAATAYMQSGCSREGDPEEPTPPPPKMEQLQNLKEAILPWAVTCEANGIGYACEEGSDGDSMLFMGMLCLSGQEEQCSAIPTALGGDGQPFRAPSQRTDWKNTFSRDMMLGLFAYWVKHPEDTLTAELFHDYVSNNDYKLCDDSFEVCNMGPQYVTMWSIWGKVWQDMGLERTTYMQVADWGDDTLLQMGSNVMPEGFQLHLVAVEIWLRREIGTWNFKLQKASEKLTQRQPENPFFEYLAHGASDRAVDLTLQYCPTTKPSPAKQWFPQRDTAEQAWNNSMGWDCIFLVNLLTQ